MLNLQRLRNKWVLWAAVLLALGGGAFSPCGAAAKPKRRPL